MIGSFFGARILTVIITGIIGALIAALIGAWINSVFTWRIKSKVDSIDLLYGKLWEIENLFRKYCLLQFKINNNCNSSIEAEEMTKQVTDIKDEVSKIQRMLYLFDSILNKRFNTEIIKFTNIIAEGLNDRYLSEQYVHVDHKPSSKEVTEKLKVATSFFNEILDHRKEIISFNYMLKELLYNKVAAIIFLVVALIGGTLYYVHQDSISPATNIIINLFKS